MAEHFVFRTQGAEYEGMRIPSGLYSAIVATAHENAKKELPNLLADNVFNNRMIKKNQVGAFEDELSYTGKIILTHPLINYAEVDEQEIITLENKFTTTEAGVTLATLIELCEEVKNKNCGLSIKLEDGNYDNSNLSLNQELRRRLTSSLYLPGTTDVKDYKKGFTF